MKESVKNENEGKKADHPKAWIVYIGRSMEENFLVGKLTGIWGFTEGRFKLNNTINKIQEGDTVLFFGPALGAASGFTPRLSEEKFYELVKKAASLNISEVTAFKITAGYWNEIEKAGRENRIYCPVWPDEGRENKRYPHRFLFDRKPVQGLKDIPVGQLSRNTIDVLRKVMISSPGSVEEPLHKKIMEDFANAIAGKV
jgi:hypothetical protein